MRGRSRRALILALGAGLALAGSNLLGLRAVSDGRHRRRAAILTGAFDETLTGAGLHGLRSVPGRGFNLRALGRRNAGGVPVTVGATLGLRTIPGRCIRLNASASTDALGLAVTGGGLFSCRMGLGSSLGRGFSIPAHALDVTVGKPRRIDLRTVLERSLCGSAAAPIVGIPRGFGGRYPVRRSLGYGIAPGRSGRSASGVSRVRRWGRCRTGAGAGFGDRGQCRTGMLIS
jgi:hypothetical protein